jgi:hypothetical protein
MPHDVQAASWRAAAKSCAMLLRWCVYRHLRTAAAADRLQLHNIVLFAAHAVPVHQ